MVFENHCITLVSEFKVQRSGEVTVTGNGWNFCFVFSRDVFCESLHISNNLAVLWTLPSDGMNFLPAMTSLKPFSFLSIEATQWLMQNVDGVNSKEEAVNLGQVRLQGQT